MNPADSNQPAIDPAWLDLLVDGELPEPQRRELLERLDRIPNGWRSCALAFLDAQCWRESLGPLAQEKARIVPARRPRTKSRPAVVMGTVLAMAASFLAALGIGLAVRSGWFSGPRGGAGGSLAGGPAEVQSPAPRPQSGPGFGSTPQLARDDRQSPLAIPEPPAGSRLETVRVSLPDPLGLGEQQLDLPVTQAERLDESWLRPAPLPPDLCEGLRRMGYEIRQHRELVPAPLDDGRRVVMPVDQVEIRYVGNGPYQ